jgi:hypothetical protein
VSETLHGEMPFLDERNSISVADENALIAVLRDRGELGKRARAAGELAATRFSTEVMAMGYERVYREWMGPSLTGV